jgi:transcriptional regulator with XRE-family HTH domain
MSVFDEAHSQRQRLGQALRALREAAGLSGMELSRRSGISQSKVSRSELGQQLPSVGDLDRWAEETGATAEQRAELGELREQAATEAVAWRRHLRRGLEALQQETAELEASAGTIRVFHPVLVPGLVQTPAYAKAIYQAAHPAGREDLAEAVAARMNRQALLYDEAKRFEFVLSEAGLRWRLAPRDALLGQLDRLGMVASLPNVRLGIMPLAAEVTPWHSHSFNIFDDRPDDGPVVHIEMLTTGLNVRDPEDVAAYQQAFERLQAAAVHGDELRLMLERLAKELRETAA